MVPLIFSLITAAAGTFIAAQRSLLSREPVRARALRRGVRR